MRVNLIRDDPKATNVRARDSVKTQQTDLCVASAMKKSLARSVKRSKNELKREKH